MGARIETHGQITSGRKVMGKTPRPDHRGVRTPKERRNPLQRRLHLLGPDAVVGRVGWYVAIGVDRTPKLAHEGSPSPHERGYVIGAAGVGGKVFKLQVVDVKSSRNNSSLICTATSALSTSTEMVCPIQSILDPAWAL